MDNILRDRNRVQLPFINYLKPDTLQCIISVNFQTILWDRVLLSPFTGEETENQRDHFSWNQASDSGLSDYNNNDFLGVVHSGTAVCTKAGRWEHCVLL